MCSVIIMEIRLHHGMTGKLTNVMSGYDLDMNGL
uniref:Uncharacterized protein n=1 Tax=Anguilla anguilla TaxID=7936 RepID=A0A0E9S4E3_ANGAN